MRQPFPLGVRQVEGGGTSRRTVSDHRHVRPFRWRTKSHRPVAPPFRTPPRLNLQPGGYTLERRPRVHRQLPRRRASVRRRPSERRRRPTALDRSRPPAGAHRGRSDRRRRQHRHPGPHRRSCTRSRQDDFARCGGDVYARGHIRTLARAVRPRSRLRCSRSTTPTTAAVPRRPRPPRCSRRNASAPSAAAQLDRGHGRRDRRRDRLRRLHRSSRAATTAATKHAGRRGLHAHDQQAASPTPTADQARRPEARPVRQRHRGRPAGQGDRPGQRRRRTELDLRQGPQRPAALRRTAQAGRVQDLPGQREDRPRPRRRRRDRALRERQEDRGRVPAGRRWSG